MKEKYYDKVLGSLLGNAIGDAMGAVTENLTFNQIREKYAGGVREFLAPDESAFAYGNAPGQVTDDFSQTYLLTEEILKNAGKIEASCVEEMLIRWSNIPRYFNRFAGPTTRAAITSIKTRKNGNTPVSNEVIDYARRATNGSAMKIAPAGFFNPCDVDKAIKDAITITRVTHDNHLAISGACAVAAAISHAFEKNATVYSIIQAGLYGAEEGEKEGIKISRIVGGPSVKEKMNLAISIALQGESKEAKLKKIYDYVGTGLHISEAVPATFGIILACQGDNWDSICEAVNIGYDTDTIAAITGSIVGALNGTKGIPKGYLEIINRENEVSVDDIALSVSKLI